MSTALVQLDSYVNGMAAVVRDLETYQYILYGILGVICFSECFFIFYFGLYFFMVNNLVYACFLWFEHFGLQTFGFSWYYILSSFIFSCFVFFVLYQVCSRLCVLCPMRFTLCAVCPRSMLCVLRCMPCALLSVLYARYALICVHP